LCRPGDFISGKILTYWKRYKKLVTRLIINNRGLTYREKSKNLGLTTLEIRRLRKDLIEVFKIFKGLDDGKPTDFFHYVKYWT